MSSSLTGAPSTFWIKLCEAFLLYDDLSLQEAERKLAISKTAEFVVSQTACLTADLRILSAIAIFIFQSVVFIRYGKTFADLSVAERQKEIKAWSHPKHNPIGKLLRSIRSLAVLYFFEQNNVLMALDKSHKI